MSIAAPLSSATDFIKRASAVAHHFGFVDLSILKQAAQHKEKEPGREQPKIGASHRRLDALHGLLTAGASAYLEQGLSVLGEPALFYTIDEVPRTGEVALSLHIIGVEKSIAEMLLIHTIRSLYRDLSLPEHVVHINSVGDRESLGRYTRELGNYLKKRLEYIPPATREIMKEHVLLALQDLIERDHELGAKSPSALEYLNEASRKHFREVIEYLDYTEAPYEIDTRLIGHHQCYSHTLFSVAAFLDEGRSIRAPIEARGGRYDEFIYQHARRHMSAVGAVVFLKERKIPARIPRHKRSDPQVFVIQLGFGPKLRALTIIDELRHVGIPVFQSLASDSLSTQLEEARHRNVPYTIILGQKEYVDGNVIVRNMRSSSQENVPISHLINHLRRSMKI